MWYFKVALFLGILGSAWSFIVYIIWPTVVASFRFIDDSDSRLFPPSWEWAKNHAPAFVFDDGDLLTDGYKSFRYHEMAPALIVGIFVSFLVGVAWLPALVVGTVYGFLLLLRLIRRLGKKIGKLATFSHSHPSTVPHTKEEI